MPSIAHATKRPSLCESPTRLASALGQSPPSIAAAHWLCGKGNAATRGAKMERRRTTARTAQRPASAVTPPHTGLPYLHNRPSPPTAAVCRCLRCARVQRIVGRSDGRRALRGRTVNPKGSQPYHPLRLSPPPCNRPSSQSTATQPTAAANRP